MADKKVKFIDREGGFTLYEIVNMIKRHKGYYIIVHRRLYDDNGMKEIFETKLYYNRADNTFRNNRNIPIEPTETKFHGWHLRGANLDVWRESDVVFYEA